MALNHLKIIQHNVQAWTFDRKNELYNSYQQEDPDIILINSHGRKDEEKIKIFNYTVYQRNQFNEAHDGVAIAIKNNIQHRLIDELDENYLAVIITTTLGEICVATGYQPPRRAQIPLNNLLNITRRNMPAYFFGDLNARHGVLGHRSNNAAGRLIHNLIRDGALVHLGPDFQTYITGGRSGTPDVALANNRHLHNIHISPGSITTSDHLPVIIHLSASPIQIQAPEKYNLNRANWEAFRQDLGRMPTPEMNLRPAEDINMEMNKWFVQITRAMKKHIPKTKYRTLPHPRITEEIREIQSEYNTLQQAVHQNQNQWTRQQRTRLRELQLQLQNVCRQERDQHWNSMLMEIEAEYRDPAKFWRGIQRLLGGGKQKIPYILDPNGRKIYSKKEQETEFRRFWANIYQISEEENAEFCPDTERQVEEYLRQHEQEYKPYEQTDTSRLDARNSLIAPITIHEVKKTIKKFKNKKAPGISQINKEIMLQLPDNMLRAYTNILNASLSVGLFPRKFKKAIIKFIPKADKTTTLVQNHRPISLLEAAAKLYEQIINKRLRHFLQEHEHNNNNQHSYRTNRGTHTALALLYEEIAVSQENRENCNIVMRDVSKAFDKIYHKGLKYKILQLALPRCFTALLCNFLDERTACIQLGDHAGEQFQLHSGVPQGSCLSPTLFNLYVADLGELRYGKYIQYADDVTQIVRYPGRRAKQMTKRITERAIQEVNDFERKWKIKTNQTKFNILHVSKTQPPMIEINGNEIPYQREARILGLKLTRTGHRPHIKERINLAKIALSKIKRFSGMASRTKAHLYKALVAPHLSYPPVPLNAISRSNQEKLQAIQNRALRWINGDVPPYHTTTEDLHHQYKMQPLNIKHFKAGLRVWNTLREHQPNDTRRLAEADTTAPHTWWPRSYIPPNAPPPEPLYCRRRPREPNAEEDMEEEEEEEL